MLCRLTAITLTACAVTTAAADTPASAASRAGCANANLRPEADNLAQVRAATRCLVNRERTKRGRRALRRSPSLRTAATGYARQMERQNFFAHVSPGGSTVVQRIRRTAYLEGASTWRVGENLAWGSGTRATPRRIVRAWMASPGHRANILRRAYRHVGIGLAMGAPVEGVSGATTYVTEFGTRA